MVANAASYYADLTEQYLHYGGDAHGWHYGIWESDVATHAAALLRSNECLLRGLDVTPSTRILDVGFGEGGFSVWAAEHRGAQVTGITVCPEHVALARGLAARHGVTARCEFLVMNMDQLGFGPDSFDIVVNQETACYARDKLGYLAGVWRVLKPGGVWRNLDFSVRHGSFSDAEARSYRDVCDGFHIPSLVSLQALLNLLERTGFEVLDGRDMTSEVLPTAAMIRRQCYLPLLMKYLHLDWAVYSREREQRNNRQGHVLAAHRYSRGLERGFFRNVYCSARKPAFGASVPGSSTQPE